MSQSSSPVVALVAGETSGDLLGADLMQGLKQQYPNARFVGIGGEKMQAQGLESWFAMEQLSVMGLFEVLRHLPALLRLRKTLLTNLLALKPDVFIGIDAPDFNFTLERKLKQAGIKTVHYVGPSVWAWRESRLQKIKHCVDGMLVLFPFEPPIYQKHDIPVQYVGHPLAKQALDYQDQQVARDHLKLDAEVNVTALLPGSRMSEINIMADIYVQAAHQLALIYPDMQFVIPCVHEKARERITQAIERYGQHLTVHLYDRQANEVIAAADQLIVTSGTATLQAALWQKPMVISIRIHPLSHWIMKKLAITQWIGLPNVLAQKSLVPELIQDQASAHKIALELGRLVLDQKARRQQTETFAEQLQQLNQDSAQLAAQAVIKWAQLK